MPISPYQIAGQLPWGGGGANMDFTGSPAGLGASYANSYRDALAMNAGNYGNILQGYQQVIGGQQQAQNEVSAGYTGLYNDVLGKIAGTQQAQAQAINDSYAQQSGAQAQSLINRGLGNTTIQNSVQRGLGLDQNKALTNNQNQFAQLQAQYMSQLGLAGLQQRQQSVMANSALAGRQLDWMNSVNAAYPNAGMYSQLAQQYGAAQQQNADRAQLNRPGVVSQQGSIGYTPSGSGFAPPQSFGGGSYGFTPGGGGMGFNAAASYQPPPAAWSGYLAQPQAGGAGFFQGVANDVAGGLYGQAVGGYGGGYEDAGLDNPGAWYEY